MAAPPQSVWIDVSTFLNTFFNNASVGGFVGAASAFLFLLLWDRRKDRKVVQHIANEIDRARAHTAAKVETAERNLAAIRHDNQVRGADILKFDTEIVKRLLSEAWHLLTLDQQRAVDAIVHRLEGADRVLAEVERLTAELRETAREDPARSSHMERLVTTYRDAIVNLKTALEMAENYGAKRFADITAKQYQRSDYEELLAGPPGERVP